MKKAIFIITLIFILLGSYVDVKAGEPKDSPYFIKVNKTNHVMSIYSKGDNGEYIVLVGEYKVATGRTPGLTPIGTFTLGSKEAWHDWGGTTSPYTTSYAKGLYIHGPLYNARNFNNVIQSSVSEIGFNKTSGCLRTSVEAAKFVFDNCPQGTKVEINN